MIKKMFIYALQTFRIFRLLWSCLVFVLHLFLPKAKKICREDIIEELKVTCNRYCESVVSNNKKMKKIAEPILVPFRKSVYGKCPEKCPMCNNNESCDNRFELKVYTPKKTKIEYYPGCMVVKNKKTSRKYVVLVHVPIDDIMASQGLDIDHYVSVLMFDEEQLVTIWAYNNEKGVIKLG